MKRKIFEIIGVTIALAGLLFVVGTVGINDLAAEQGTAGLTTAETLLRSAIGILLFAAGTIGALTFSKRGCIPLSRYTYRKEVITWQKRKHRKERGKNMNGRTPSSLR